VYTSKTPGQSGSRVTGVPGRVGSGRVSGQCHWPGSISGRYSHYRPRGMEGWVGTCVAGYVARQITYPSRN